MFCLLNFSKVFGEDIIDAELALDMLLCSHRSKSQLKIYNFQYILQAVRDFEMYILVFLQVPVPVYG